MLHAYIDESGHEGGPLCVIAGFVGSEAQWAGFEPAWKVALGQRAHLHTTELRWGPKWHVRTGKVLRSLGPIPHEHGLTPIMGMVARQIYEQTAALNVAIAPLPLGFWHFAKQSLGSRFGCLKKKPSP